jgi:hypothetical protein
MTLLVVISRIRFAFRLRPGGDALSRPPLPPFRLHLPAPALRGRKPAAEQRPSAPGIRTQLASCHIPVDDARRGRDLLDALTRDRPEVAAEVSVLRDLVRQTVSRAPSALILGYAVEKLDATLTRKYLSSLVP